MAIFKKELYHQVTDEYTNYKLAGDWIFWAEIGNLADVAISGKHLNYFRQHEVKVTNTFFMNGSNYEEEIRALKYFHTKLNLDTSSYNKAIYEHYLRFEKSKSRFNHRRQKLIENLFYENFSKQAKHDYKIRKLKKAIISLIPFNTNLN